MRAEIDVLREVFLEWMAMHDLGPDFWIYTQAEWAKREGDSNLLKGAELIIAFENELYTMFNYPGEYSVEDELQELAGGFGYYFEFGHHWNIGFYPTGDWQPPPADSASYSDKLKDPRWQAKRQRILKRCKGSCDECGKTKPLQVHHCYYRYGRQVWQYPDGAFLALCDECHKQRQKTERDFRLFAPTLKTSQLELLKRVLRHCQYWYDEGDFTEFLETLENVPGGISVTTKKPNLDMEEYDRLRFQAEYRALRASLFKMLKRQGHPPDRGDNYPRNWL